MVPFQEDNHTNPELAELGTHSASATMLHQTRTTDAAVQIDPPVSPNPGAINNKDRKFDNRKNGQPI
ncbi:hypothetical protein O9H85_27950 [Paenibacillus filicis]|uniref:Uncharacterized protein n=1 Tax=Paenibacillus gyeongsangnamensis TaxID=3388067 RepID=A0ABT4QH86_9BACL|nr:hypothetical protein [Paenibacillus filicis]MCZ8516157.1 hypothetical protein [Paenibacillus filicis]